MPGYTREWITVWPGGGDGMERWIILLRGVSPTGKNKVPMAGLREAMARAGFINVRTWIQSGNVLADTALDRAGTEAAVIQVLRDDIKADLAVIVKTAEEIRETLDGSPFMGLPGERVFYGFFNRKPARDKAAALLAMDFGEDLLRISQNAVYLFIPGSAARTRLNNAWLQRRLGVALTFRNANTLNRLVAMAGE